MDLLKNLKIRIDFNKSSLGLNTSQNSLLWIQAFHKVDRGRLVLFNACSNKFQNDANLVKTLNHWNWLIPYLLWVYKEPTKIYA